MSNICSSDHEAELMIKVAMEHSTFTTNDNVVLSFQTSMPLPLPQSQARPTACILLLHGFSGSGEYFKRNFAALSSQPGHWVVAPDMRGHGRSGRSTGGYHVARLAADLQALIAHLRKLSGTSPAVPFIPVGCSIGAAVLWTYVELFGCQDFAGIVCVDQAPLQDRSLVDAWDETKSHRGCYDEKTMLAAQDAWRNRPAEAHAGLVSECLGYRFQPLPTDSVTPAQASEDAAFFVSISAQSDNLWLARLLADHTHYDHREACERIDVPTLVMAGNRTGCFPLEGMRETVERVNKTRSGLAAWSLFEAGHWLFYEEPERFNREILEFVGRCLREVGQRGA
jgi:pimeloyl-ACP methyl ester carboxylesterase